MQLSFVLVATLLFVGAMCQNPPRPSVPSTWSADLTFVETVVRKHTINITAMGPAQLDGPNQKMYMNITLNNLQEVIYMDSSNLYVLFDGHCIVEPTGDGVWDIVNFLLFGFQKQASYVGASNCGDPPSQPCELWQDSYVITPAKIKLNFTLGVSSKNANIPISLDIGYKFIATVNEAIYFNNFSTTTNPNLFAPPPGCNSAVKDKDSASQLLQTFYWLKEHFIE